MKPIHTTEILWFTAGDKKKRSRHQNYTEKTEMIPETKTSNLMNDYFGYYTKKLGKIELKDWVKKEEEIKSQRGFM